MQNIPNAEHTASSKITFLDARKSDMGTSLNILNEGLGEGFVTLSELTTFIEEDNKICLVAKEGSDVLAVITAEAFPEAEEFLLQSLTICVESYTRPSNFSLMVL